MTLISPRAWLRRHRWTRRFVLFVSALWLTLISVGASLALADSGAGISVANPLLSWMKLTDTKGVPVYAYQISGPTSDLLPSLETFYAGIANLCWLVYVDIAAYGIWFIDWVNGFSWFSLLNDPATAISSKFSLLLSQIHITQAFMVIAGVVAFLHYALGRKASAVYDLVATWVIAALTVGALANPIGTTGGDNGLIMQARSSALQAAGAMITPTEGEFALDTRNGKVVDQPKVNVSTDTQALQSQLTSSMVDVFIRWPNQLVNFGKILDGGACESTYTDTVKSGPYNDSPVVMEKIKGCDEAAGNFAEHPTPSQGMTSLALTPAAVTLILLAIALAGGIISAVALILYKSVTMLWSSIQALLPGGARMPLFMDIGEIAASFILLVVSVFLMAIYIFIITDLFKSASHESVMETFVKTDIVLIVLWWIYKQQKERIRAVAGSIASFLAKRPGGGMSAPAPRRNWAPAAAAAGALGTAYTAACVLRRRHRSTPSSNAGGNHTQNNLFFFGIGGQGNPADTETERQPVDLKIVDDEPQPQRTRQRLLAITAKTAGHAVLGHATGGVSTAAIAAMRARRAALAARAKHQQLTAATNRIRGILPGGPQPKELGPGPRGPRRPGGGDRPANPGPKRGGFLGWLRNRRTDQPSQEGYSRVRTSGGSVVLVQQGAPARGRTPFWRRRG